MVSQGYVFLCGMDNGNEKSKVTGARVCSSLPVFVVDPRAVEQGSDEALSGTHALQHQADPIQGRQKEQGEGEEEAAVIGLPHTAVYPGAATTHGGRTDAHIHTGRQNIVLKPRFYYTTHTL